MTCQVAKAKLQALGERVALHHLRLWAVSFLFTVLAEDNSWILMVPTSGKYCMLHSFEKGNISNSNLSATNSGWGGGFIMLSLPFWFFWFLLTEILVRSWVNNAPTLTVLEKKLFLSLICLISSRFTLNPGPHFVWKHRACFHRVSQVDTLIPCVVSTMGLTNKPWGFFCICSMMSWSILMACLIISHLVYIFLASWDSMWFTFAHVPCSFYINNDSVIIIEKKNKSNLPKSESTDLFTNRLCWLNLPETFCGLVIMTVVGIFQMQRIVKSWTALMFPAVFTRKFSELASRNSSSLIVMWKFNLPFQKLLSAVE